MNLSGEVQNIAFCRSKLIAPFARLRQRVMNSATSSSPQSGMKRNAEPMT
jgi:hypothetical protein